jgi:hypothetical protein
VKTFSFLFVAFISALVFFSLLPRSSSADPLDIWHWRNPLPQGNNLTGIVFGNGLFVAVEVNSRVDTSADLVNWTRGASAATNDQSRP